MISTAALRRSAPRFVGQVIVGRQNTLHSVIGSQAGSILQQGWTCPTSAHSFSTAALDGTVVTQTPGSVTKKLRVLNMDTVKNILKELNAVDRNSDGR